MKREVDILREIALKGKNERLSYIIIVPAVHHPTKLRYPHFELIFGDFVPALLEVSFGTILHNS